jgi:Raf kinase inhibitor-like YbhB/YbcL family protein
MKRPKAMRRIVIAALAAAAVLAGRRVLASTSADPGSPQAGAGGARFALSSAAFADKEAIPVAHTGFAADQSPPLAWENPPAGSKAFALVCSDPDAMSGDWVHWVLYDIPAEIKALPKDLPKTPQVLGSARQGRNDFGKIGYGGPMPPPGKMHRYFFRLYALDRPTGLGPAATKAELLGAIKGHVLGETFLVGTYRR